ncbi:Sec7 domain-containing protein [Apiospora phragmitis]|uniref:Sec7 domain-containing protein n=1 Tax=Apiospora phragmitis TaxID=2905665 RepID=A0ABR1TU01_9PEZI
MYPSPEGSRRSHRRRPELNIDTLSSSPPQIRDTRPSTPPSLRRPPVPPKGKPPVSGRALRMQQPPSISSTTSSRDRDFDESFLDTFSSPVDMTANKENEPDFVGDRLRKTNYRDSHDLSLPSRQITRDSLVTNMLASLDQFSLGQIHTPATPQSPFDEPSTYRSMSLGGRNPARTISSIPQRNRTHSSYNNHGHHYTYSSDFEGTDDAGSRISSPYSRGHRSNSSSGFQPGVGRLNSMRESPTQQRGNQMAGGRVLHSRGVSELHTALGIARPASTWAKNTLPYPQPMQLHPAPNNVAGSSACNLEFSNTLWAEDYYEPAPTPTVHGGPRRPTLTNAPTAIPQPLPFPQQQEHEPERKSVSASDRKMSMRSNRTTGTAGRGAASSNYELPPLPPLPTTEDMDSAPAPHVGYEKAKEKELGLAGANTTTQPNQPRPGFFKRMFGGSSKAIASAFDSASTSSNPPHVSPAAVETQPRPNTSRPQTQPPQQQQNAYSAPPSRDSQQATSFTGQHVVQKKSSFFRRRKRSIAEPPPPVPQAPAAHMSRSAEHPAQKARQMDPSGYMPDPSPVSSLRQVMSPYLKESGSASPLGLLPPRNKRDSVSPHYNVEDPEDDRRRKSRGFSPDYDPSPKATIRTVKSQSALVTRSRDSVTSPSNRTPVASPPMPTQRPKLTRDTTFFEDSSDTEGDKAKRSGKAKRNRPRRSTSPTEDTYRDDGAARSIPKLAPTDGDGSYRENSSANASPYLGGFEEEKKERPESLGLPIQDQPSSGRVSALSRSGLERSTGSLPSVQIDGAEANAKPVGSPLDEPEVTVGEPTEDDRLKAQRIFEGREDFITKDRAASWMGEEGPVRQRTLRAYMELYDFAEKSVLTALREVCGRLILRAETQQVDRILVCFSNRWCDCNPNHGFKTMDVIHTMCYSIMLLNTDLHLADIESKMTRSQFVKNTMTTIKQAVEDSAPEAFDRPSILPGRNTLLSPTESEMRAEPEQKRDWRSSFIPPRAESRQGDHEESEGCGPLVKTPFHGSMRAWENLMEVVLKDIYNSIRDEKLPLFGGGPEAAQSSQQNGNLSVVNMLMRTPSVLSKAPSECPSSRGRMDGPNRPNNGRWSSKSRSRPRLGTNGFSSSRTSFDDGNSLWSPTVSSATWSRYSLGRTQTTPSVDSLGSSFLHGDYQQSIGFANALAHAIIREDGPATSSQSIMSDELNSAALLQVRRGPRKGMVVHKHHLDGVDKKAKDRNWSEVFAVVQKGQMSIFSFSTKSMRQKARGNRKPAPGGVVGGGNWQENATNLGTFSLRQTLASALPAPGYSRTRPHVWALSLPTGAVHLFQVGTPEICKEFVLTVNYWSARLSTHPLVGGISNIEYGWSDACINNALVSAINNENTLPPRPGSATAGRQSVHSRRGSQTNSLRSSFDLGSSSNRTKLPGDRIHIAEWTPPAQSLRASNCTEPEQFETLLAYVRGIEEELQKHNQLRSPMLLAFTPRGSNATKAMNNWERKSSYLLREIVKFRTYVDCLQYAEQRRKEIYDERQIAQRAARGDEISDSEDEQGETMYREE